MTRVWPSIRPFFRRSPDRFGEARRRASAAAELEPSGPHLVVVFAALGLTSGLLTYLVLSNLTPIRPDREVVWTLLSANIFIICGLIAVLIGQALRLRRRRRAGLAGAYMHGRMVMLFSLIAALPAILMAVFAIVTLDRGLDYWFSARTKTIIDNTAAVSNAYLSEQRAGLRDDVSLMAEDMAEAIHLLEKRPQRFLAFLQAQSGLRKMPQALIIDGDGVVLAAASPEETILTTLPPPEAFAAADNNTVILSSAGNAQILGLRKIAGEPARYLYTTRLMSRDVMQQMVQTEAALRDYAAMSQRRFETQLTFALIYIVMTLVILLSAIWLGLALADRLVLPIGRLIQAARRLGEGDLQSRVSAGRLRGNDEIKELAVTFNEMAERLSTQQHDLMQAHSDLDERARFTETVLHGVSSGVIGIDRDGRINHANEAAGALYGAAPDELVGRKLADEMAEFSALAARAMQGQGAAADQITRLQPPARGHTLQAAAVPVDGGEGGVVITFDDVTDLLTAQRNAAWADIARRIAHEIKNPLTPIQLSAERLQSKYGDSVDDTSEIFRKCTDTIIRQVEDIGRMVDEFAAFARMPTAVMAKFDLHDVVMQAVLLQRVAHPDIDFEVDCPDRLDMLGDRRLVGQALTNVLKNAAEAVTAGGSGTFIRLTAKAENGRILVSVSDSGIGWPKRDRYALLEPYNTSRQEGTGLGLSIVKKVMEDHGGKLTLEDAPWCSSGGTGATVQLAFPLPVPETVGQSKVLEEM